MKTERIPFFFIHIPKTGGVTFQYILNKQYGSCRKFTLHPYNNGLWQKLSNDAKLSYKIIKGHFRFKPDLYPGKCIYFTFLREPEKRLLSHYNFIKTTVTHRLYREMKEKNYSLMDLVENGKIPNLDNCMVRYIAGCGEKKFGEVNESDLQKAISNFDNYFKNFGILEKYDESLLILSYELGWKTPYYTLHNEGKVNVNKSKIDSETKEAILICNRYDELLWKHACVKFEEKVKKHKEKLDLELLKFKEKNRGNRFLINNLQKVVRIIIRFFQLIFIKIYPVYHKFKK